MITIKDLNLEQQTAWKLCIILTRFKPGTSTLAMVASAIQKFSFYTGDTRR